jgi:hypothetical protein
MAELLGYAFEAGRAAETDYDGYPSFSLTDLRYIELDRFLQHVAWAVRRFGWVSGSAAFNNEFLTATKSIAISNMFPTAWDRKHNVIEDPIDADIAFAAEAHEWARTFALKDNLNDYEHNVLVIAEATYIEYRSIGLAASIVGVHFRNSEKTKADALKDRLTSVFDRKKFDDIIANSPFMGQPGDKVKNLVVEVIGVKRFEFSMLLKLLTEDGHVLSWFATSFEANLGDRVVITSGTIREHKLYEGNRETNLTRCRATKVADA